MPLRKVLPSTPTVVVLKRRPTPSQTPAVKQPGTSPSVTPPTTAPSQAGKHPSVKQSSVTPQPVQPAPGTPPPPHTAPVASPPSAPSSQPGPNQPNAKQRQREALQALLVLFRKRWPRTFPTDFRLIRPFALGIHQALIEALPEVKPWLIRRALGLYQTAGYGSYWRAVLQGGSRYNLDGTPQGEVTARDQEHAKDQLAAIAAWWKAKREGRREEGREG